MRYKQTFQKPDTNAILNCENRSTNSFLSEAEYLMREMRWMVNKGVIDQVKKRLFQKFLEADYQQDVFTSMRRGYGLSFSKSTIDNKGIETLMNYIKWRQSAKYCQDALADTSNWYAIDRLEYTINGVSIDAFKMLPHTSKILFCPSSNENDGTFNKKAKIMMVLGDLASVGTLSIILHEAGHANTKVVNLSDLVGGNELEQEKATGLLEERRASLFALRVISNALRRSKEKREDVVQFLRSNYAQHCDHALAGLRLAKLLG